MGEAATLREGFWMRPSMNKDNERRRVVWNHVVKVDDAVTFRAGTRGSRLVAEWPGLATLACARDGSRARFIAAPGASARAIGKLQRGQARALLCDLRGGLGLHASAVAIGRRAVLFIGPSGSGKSTAAAEMCLQHGGQLLADDAVSIEVDAVGIHVLPCEKDHWLTRDSCLALGVSGREMKDGDKRDFCATNVASEPCLLSLVLALRFQSSATVAALRPLRGGDAALSLLEAAIRFDVEDAVARRREFEQVTAVYRCAPFLELVRRPKHPGGVAPWVLEALKRGAS
jgi:hypothetical protein